MEVAASLDSLRKKTLATAPCSTLLGKEVLEKCAARLKPCLLQLMRDMNMNLDDYCKVLGSILHEVPEGENMVENAGSVPPVEGTSAHQLPEDSKKLHTIKDYRKELVGAKVKVWWPRDKRFYEGVVSFFNPNTKKHKVIYTDDDVEILNLRRERWELLEEVPVKEGRVTDLAF